MGKYKHFLNEVNQPRGNPWLSLSLKVDDMDKLWCHVKYHDFEKDLGPFESKIYVEILNLFDIKRELATSKFSFEDDDAIQALSVIVRRHTIFLPKYLINSIRNLQAQGHFIYYADNGDIVWEYGKERTHLSKNENTERILLTAHTICDPSAKVNPKEDYDVLLTRRQARNFDLFIKNLNR